MEKNSLPVDVFRLETPLLKPPNNFRLAAKGLSCSKTTLEIHTGHVGQSASLSGVPMVQTQKFSSYPPATAD